MRRIPADSERAVSAVTISSRGRVTIPVRLRLKYDLHAGDRVQLVDYGDGIAIFPVADHPVAAACGMLPGPTSLTKRLMADRRQEMTRER